jgi:predicted NUDIX family phosphoesterase
MKFENTFRKIELLDTSKIKLNDVNYSVTDNILDIIDDYTSERIGYVNLDDLELQNEKSFYYNNIFNDINFDFDSREKVESAEDKVQPIPVAIITNKERNRILVAKKNKKQTSEDSPESNKLLVYFGGHTRKEDLVNQKNNMISLIRSSLTREVKEETNLDFTPFSEEFDNPLCIWDRSHEKSKKHIAICHILEVDFDTIKYKLDKNEFMTGGNTLSGKIYSKDEIFKEYDKLEPWSQIILENFFGYKTLFTNND